MLMLTKDVLFNLHQCSFSGSWSWDDQYPENEYWTEQQVLFSLKSALIFWYLTFEEAIKTRPSFDSCWNTRTLWIKIWFGKVLFQICQYLAKERVTTFTKTFNNSFQNLSFFVNFSFEILLYGIAGQKGCEILYIWDCNNTVWLGLTIVEVLNVRKV